MNLTNDTARYAPQTSWWICPRQNFTRECARQFQRMRWSYFATRSTLTSAGRGISSAEQYRHRRALRERGLA